MASVETVTLLFTDLVGSTGLASRVGPGAAEELRRQHFALLREAIGENGGREVKNLGDGLMVSFPSSSGAVSCAVAMQQLLDLRNRSADEQLMIRIGISAGEADVDEGDYFGPPVIEAARLCNRAAGGQILCGDLVRMMAREGHAFRSVGRLDLKGLPEPYPTHEVEWEPLSMDAGALPLPQRLREVPPLGYVGRSDERARLAELLAQAREGCRRVAFLSGEPGIGKTRLASHLAVEAHGEGATVLFGRCDEDLGLPYGPWVEALRHYVAEAPSEVIAAHSERYGGELARLVPELRGVSGYPAPTETDPETERFLLFAAVAGLLEDAARESPLVLILDDLHWADKPSLMLLRHLVTRGGDLRLLVIGTYRDSDLTRGHPLAGLLADLHREEGVSRLPLTGLAHDDVIAIMAAAAGHDVQADGRQLAQAILRETDGNPFYVGELLRHLRESGAIVQGADGRFRLRGTIEELGLPQSVREVVGRRIERLSEEARRALTIAAVIGRDFDVALLAPVVEVGEDALLDSLDEALEASVINEASGGVGRFTFAHALINHTLYDELSRTRRARLHARVAAAIEAQCGDDPGERVAELAHHSLKAATPDHPAKAVEYARRAGERALSELAPDDALRWFGQAIELADQTPASSSVLRCDLLIGLGEAQRQTGDPKHRETLLAASALADELADADRAARAAVANSRGWNRVFGKVDAELIAAIDRAVALDGLREPARSARLMARQAAELQFDPDHERRWALADKALALAREAGDERTLVHVLFDYAYATWGRNNVPQKRAERAELSELARKVGDPALSAWADQSEATLLILTGDVAGFEATVARVLAAVDGLGQPALRWFASYFAAALAFIRGDLDEAERMAGESAQIGTEAGQADAAMIYAVQLSIVRGQQGRAGELLELMRQSVEQNPGLPAWRAALALFYAYTGRLDDAGALVSEAVDDRLAAIPFDQARTSALVNYSEVAFILRDRRAAGVLYEALDPWADQFVFTGASCSGSARLYLGMLASLQDEHDLADEHFALACRLHECQGMPLHGAHTRARWAQALGRRGDTDRAREQAELALAVARERGYVFVEQVARSVLEPVAAE